jgi:hypothetical protein
MKQLFIIGCPRSGTTYLLRLLASNQQFSWVSNKLNNDTENYALSEELKIFENYFSGKKKYFVAQSGHYSMPFPVEPWLFWNDHYPYFQWNVKHFFTPRNANVSDVNDAQVQKIRTAVDQINSASGRVHFLSKYTDFPRINLLLKAFPDAKFVHLVRDGRAVANSYHKKVESGEFKTSAEEDNWVSAWPEEWQKEYKEKFHNPLAFTLYQWKFFLDEIKNEIKTINPDQILEVKYSDMIKDTRRFTQGILDFAGVEMDGSMKNFIKKKPGDNKNNKWQDKLTESEKTLYSQILSEERFKALLD